MSVAAMETQKEALSRIINTLTNKNQELKDFLQTVDNTLTHLKEETCTVTSDLEAELETLSSALSARGEGLRDVIREEEQRKEKELRKQLTEGASALSSCEDLLLFAHQSLSISSEDEFLQAAKQIKERVTMAPAFRLSTRPAASQNMSQFTVDFSTEKTGLQRLGFLPVPKAPEIDVSSLVVRDNTISVAWRPDGDDVVECYDVEHRKTDSESPRQPDACWDKIPDVRETHTNITGLKFDSRFVVVRVRAKNKMAAGEFSEPVAIETKALAFGFDALSAHAELKVEGDHVTWEPQGKGHDPRHDPRLRGKENKNSSRSTTPSPNKMTGNRAARFAGESYTVLGDTELSGGCHYWEMVPLSEWKSFSVGVAYRNSLGRFDQLGKSSTSWCLSASQWLSCSVSAKHNNRVKTLEAPPPQRVGVYCDYDNGEILFVDVDRLRLLHGFKTKFSSSLVPAFTVWCGGITIATGLQVPSFMGNFLSTNRSPSH